MVYHLWVITCQNNIVFTPKIYSYPTVPVGFGRRGNCSHASHECAIIFSPYDDWLRGCKTRTETGIEV